MTNLPDTKSETAMGIDLLDLTFRAERVFKIKLSVGSIIEQTNTVCPETNRRDLQVRSFVQMVKHAIEEQHSSYEDHLLQMLRPHIAECLGIKEAEIVLDAWMIHDLGMKRWLPVVNSVVDRCQEIQSGLI